MNLKLAILLAGFVTSTVYAADAAQAEDEMGQPTLIVFEEGDQTRTNMTDDENGISNQSIYGNSSSS